VESRRLRRSPAVVLRPVAFLAVGLPAAIAAGQTPTPTQSPTQTPTPPSTILVCDVAPSTGSDFGQFGEGKIKNNDVVAIFTASLLTPPPAGSALFSAMDSAPADTPPACGGDGQIKNNDVVACFQRSLLGGPNFTRTHTGGIYGTCTSALAVTSPAPYRSAMMQEEKP
jgi:hypothetical protein